LLFFIIAYTTLNKLFAVFYILYYKIRKKCIAIPSAISSHEKYWQYGGDAQKSIANNIAILLVLQY